MLIVAILIQLVTVLLLGYTCLMAKRQVNAVYETLKANHEWNRRKAAQDALLQRPQRVSNSKLLDETFRYLDTTSDQFPLEVVKEACQKNPEVKRALHSFLNYYEGLARGVQQEVYDDEVVRIACRGIMKRTLERYRGYIADRRKMSPHKEAWTQMEKLCKKWDEKEELEKSKQSRSPTA